MATSRALEAKTPVVHDRWTDDEGHPVSIREGRKFMRIPGESHEDTFKRMSMNAKTDLWRARSPDLIAEFLQDHVKPGEVDYPGAVLAGTIGAMGDVFQGALRLGSAGAYGLKALYHKARS